MTTLHPYSHTVFSTRLDELRQDESRAAKVSFSDKFVLRFVVYSQGARSLADKSLRSKLESDLCQFATETGIPVLDKLETVLEDDPTANIEQLQHLQALLKGVGESKDVQKRLHDIERGIRDALQSVDMEYPDDAALSTKKAFLVREMSSKLQATSDLSLQVLLVLLLGHAKHKPGVLKASG